MATISNLKLHSHYLLKTFFLWGYFECLKRLLVIIKSLLSKEKAVHLEVKVCRGGLINPLIKYDEGQYG